MAIRTRYTFWKFSTYYISLIYVSVEVLTQRFILTANSLTYLWLKRNFWLNHDHWSSVCPLPFFCLTHSEGQVTEVGSKKKSPKLIVPRLGVLRFVTQPYTEPNVTPSHHQVVSTWYGLYGQDHVSTYRWIAAKSQLYCRPKDYFRKKIGLVQPKFFFQQSILSLQLTCSSNSLVHERALSLLHTYILDKQGRYKW